MEFVAKKLYYKIGEVCEILDVEAYVLRYWEKEFGCLTPPKGKTGHRTYRPRDIELLCRIKKLLYEVGFTIEGARRQLGTTKPAKAAAGSSHPGGKRGRKPKGEPIDKVRAELQSILTFLDRE